MPTEPGQRRIGPTESVARWMSERYLPELIAPLVKGLAQKADTVWRPWHEMYGIANQEDQDAMLNNMQAGMHRTAANFQHTASALIENVQGPMQNVLPNQQFIFPTPQAPGGSFVDQDNRPFDPISEALRGRWTEHMQRAQELKGENPRFMHQLAAGFVEAPGAVGEAVASTMAMGPPGLAMLMANKFSRDPMTGEFTGLGETVKGAAVGTAMHGIAAGSAMLADPFKRLISGGTGFGILDAVQGGTNEDVARSFILGGSLTAMAPGGSKRQATDLDFHKSKAAKDARADIERPSETGEQGVKRDGIDHETVEGGERPAEFEMQPANEIPLWQKNMKERPQLDPNTRVGKMARDLELPDELPADLEIQHVVEEMSKVGGARAAYEARGGTKSWEETKAEAEELVNRVMLQEGPTDTMYRREQEGRGWDAEEIYAANILVEKRLDNFSRAQNAMRQGVPGGTADFVRALSATAQSSYALEGAKREMGRGLNILKKAKLDSLKAAAIEKVTRQARDRAVGERELTKEDPISDAELVEKYGGEEALKELSHRLDGLEDPAEVMSVLRVYEDAAGTNRIRKFVDLWLAGLLSAPPTHMANMKSTASFIAWWGLVEQPQAAMTGVLKLPFRAGKQAYDVHKALREVDREWNELPPEKQRPQQKMNPDRDPNTPETVDAESTAEAKKRFTGRRMKQRQAAMSDLNADRVLVSEAALGIVGMVRGMDTTLGATQRAWETGEAFTLGGRKTRTPFDVANSTKKAWWPFRALGAEDAWMKGISVMGRLYELGAREADALKIPWGERVRYAETFAKEVLNPPGGTTKARLREIRRYQAEALDRAELLTFTNKTGARAQAVKALAKTGPELKMTFPFVDTPVNVTKQAFYRIPVLGLLAPKNRADLMAGGIRQDRAISRVTAAGLLTAYLYNEIYNGGITGASNIDENSRELDRSRGISPFSYMTTGQQGQPLMESYARLEPLATPIATIATLVDWHERGLLTLDQIEDILPLVTAALAENIVNKSMLQGPQRTIAALSAPRYKSTIFMEQLVGSSAPALLNAAARAMDPERKDQTGLPEAVMARIPWLRDQLPTMYDLAGRPYTSGDPGEEFFARLFSEFQTPLQSTPVLEAMAVTGARINRVAKDFTITADRLAYGMQNKDTVLNPQELFMDYESLQTGLKIEASPKEREHVNSNANYYAHEELMRTVPGMMEASNLNDIKSLDVLRLAGAPQSVIEHMRMERIVRSTMLEVVKLHIQSVYLKHRETWSKELVLDWVESGKMRNAINDKMKREDRSLGFRSRLRGGPTNGNDLRD